MEMRRRGVMERTRHVKREERRKKGDSRRKMERGSKCESGGKDNADVGRNKCLAAPTTDGKILLRAGIYFRRCRFVSSVFFGRRRVLRDVPRGE